MADTSLQRGQTSDDLKDEILLFRALKPYLAQCLVLNHEINNLLSGVLGHADLLLRTDGTLTSRQKKSLQKIVSFADKIREIVENLSAEKIELAEGVDLKALTRRYRNATKPLD